MQKAPPGRGLSCKDGLLLASQESRGTGEFRVLLQQRVDPQKPRLFPLFCFIIPCVLAFHPHTRPQSAKWAGEAREASSHWHPKARKKGQRH